MAYVALSRVTSLTGLYLLDLCSVKILADVKAVLEYNRLQSKFKPELPQIQITIRNKQPYSETITHHAMEVNSLNDHPRSLTNI